MSEYHKAVLLKESIDGLRIKDDGIYVDVTFGGGGHSKEILKQLKTGQLVAFDQDEEANKNKIIDERFTLIQQNFKYLKNYLKLMKIESVDGILADLGVSSHQLDAGERGFSFRQEAVLDMRMNRGSGISAFDVVNNYTVNDLMKLFSNYGEVEQSKKIATAIDSERQLSPIKTTTQLAEIIAMVSPAKFAKKETTRVFQAIRIEVNQEIESLKQFLESSLDVLNVQGRLVVISYHSLEDRLVKNFIKSGNFEGVEQKDFYGKIEKPLKKIGGLISPSLEEVTSNPRARSAKMRIAEKL